MCYYANKTFGSFRSDCSKISTLIELVNERKKERNIMFIGKMILYNIIILGFCLQYLSIIMNNNYIKLPTFFASPH